MSTPWPDYSEAADIVQLRAAVESLIDEKISAFVDADLTPITYAATMSGGATGTVDASYVRVGKLIRVEFLATVTAIGAGTLTITTPTVMATSDVTTALGSALAVDGGNSATRRSLTIGRGGANTIFFLVDSLGTAATVTNSIPWSWANTDTIGGTFTYLEA